MYDKTLKKEGSFRKAAAKLNTTKSKFMRLWKIELGLCQRRTSCSNEPEPGKTACHKCLTYIKDNRNVERNKEYSKKYYIENKERLNEYNKIYQKNNLEKFRISNRKYRSSDKGKRSETEKRARYRASKQNATPSWVDKQALKEIYNKCPEGYHVDHIIPLTNDNVCGLHVPSNLQYLPSTVNDSKANKFDGTIENKSWMNQYSHQYRRRLETVNEDIQDGKRFDLSPKDFDINIELMSLEIRKFIERYEWLGTVGWSPKWCFTARYNGDLAGVVLISEPTMPSNLLGKENKHLEALIQRGASSSWAPKNLNSKLIMFSANWIKNNTEKRILVAYSDPEAGEIGTIYQACNFDYLGNSFGASKNYILPDGREVSTKYFTRTSSMKKWCKELGIDYSKEWLKPNGYQDYSKYPKKVLDKLKNHIRKVKATCKLINKKPKGKYALIIGNKREKAKLHKLKSYKTKPYPKRC